MYVEGHKNLDFIIHKINYIADNNYSVSHPIKDIIIDYSNIENKPAVLNGEWKNLKTGRKSSRKRIIIGKDYLDNLIEEELNNIKKYIYDHI